MAGYRKFKAGRRKLKAGYKNLAGTQGKIKGGEITTLQMDGTLNPPTKGLLAQRYQVVPSLFEVEGSSPVVDIGGIGVVSLGVD